jgi:hypothetical protein
MDIDKCAFVNDLESGRFSVSAGGNFGYQQNIPPIS